MQKTSGGRTMRFEGFLGNEQLKANLTAAAERDRFAHFYLLSGPPGAGKRTLARILTAALLCREPGEKPCGRCAACRKALSCSHPDVITVDDPEKKTVPVELVRRARADLFVRPNEGVRKIYFVPRAQDLGLPGQNALLKVLEEPPSYGVFLLLADNPHRLLPTVRSRCVELKLRPLPEATLVQALAQSFPAAEPSLRLAAARRSGGWLGQALALMREGGGLLPQTLAFGQAYAARDPVALLQVLAPMERLKRDQLLELLTQWRELLAAALAGRAGSPALGGPAQALAKARTARELAQAIDALYQALLYAQGNVSPGAICGDLAWRLR